MALDVSQVFCGYRLDRLMGKGQFGEVWRAQLDGENAKERVFALKILKPGFRPHDVERFKREFQVLTTLHHPHLAHVFQFGHDPQGRYFFASEFCSGQPLFAATEGRSVATVEEILAQLLAALDYVHGQGLVHMDLKSDNVLCEDREGRPHVKLVDFGLASRLQALPGGVAGTLAYMAPEILAKSSVKDHRVDLYSLGVLALRILSRRWPFDIKDSNAVIEWQLHGSLPKDFWKGSDVPAYLKEMIGKLLRKAPSERFSSARVALHFLNLGTGGRFRAVEDGFGEEIPAVGPFVGREESFEAVVSRLEKGFEGLSPSEGDDVFYVAGETGIGKTRFLEELRFLLELREIRVVTLVCVPNEPAWPRLSEMLGITMGGIGGRKDSPPDFSLSSGFAGEGELTWTVVERVEALANVARKESFCLLVDDLQFAEEEFQDLIRQIGRRRLPLFVVATSEELPQGIWKDTGIRLDRLGQDAVRSYVRHLLGDSDRLERVVALLFSYSDGLPLFVVEGLRYLAPYYFRGESLEGRLTAPRMSPLYREKFRTLEDGEKALVETLALLGREADVPEVQGFLGATVEKVWELTRRPLQARLLREEEGRLRISSQALGLDLAADIEPERRRVLHRTIAEGLESRPVQGGLEELADHWAAGGDSVRASELYRKASVRWRQEGQISRAVRCSREALSHVGLRAGEARDLALETAQLLILKGDYDEATRLLDARTDAPSVKGWEVRGWIAFKRRQWERALEAYGNGLKAAENEADRIALLNALANVRLQKGEREEAKRLFLQSTELEGRLPAAERGRIGNNNLGLVLGLEGKVEEAVGVIRDRIALLAPDRLPDRISHLQALGFVYLQASRFREASEALRQAVTLSETSGTYHVYLSLLRNLATSLMKEARYAEALAALKKVAAYEEGLGSKRDLAYNLLRQGGAYLILGMEEAAREGFRRGAELARDSHDASLVGWFTLMDGYWEREFGDAARARRLLEDLSSRTEGDAVLLAWSLYALADLCWETGDGEEAERLISRIAPPQGDEDFAIRLEHLRAKIKVGHGELTAAEALLDDLEARCRRGHFLETLWEIYQTRAHLRAKQGDPGEAERSLDKGVEVVEGISRALPEEYRERYLNKTSRKRLWESRKEVRDMAGEPFATRLLEINKRMVSERDPERLLEFVMDTAIEFSGASQGLLLIPDEAGGWEPRVARNVEKRDVEAVRFSRTVAEEVVRSGQPLFSLNADQDLKLQAIESVAALELKTVACIPLKIQGRVLGVVYLDTDRKRPPLKREFLPMLQSFADQAALALQNALLFSEKEKQASRLARDLEETRRELVEKEGHLQELEALVSSQVPRKTLYSYEKIIGRSKKMEEVLKTLDKVTNANVPVFVSGETGTGKELVARALHQNGRRKNGPFVAINCSAFTETILESELFGCMKGAFTGADRDRRGLFEEASGGTLFLDEVADMSLGMQAKVLRVLQEQEVMRVGGRTPIKIDVRLVSAANRDLKKLVREGRFREDLFFRIAGVLLELPPLRERREDVPLLAKHFLEKIRKENSLKPLRLTREALNRLVTYNWPGNIRELEQCLTTACLMAEGGAIRPEHLLLHKDLYKERPASAKVSMGEAHGIGFDPDKKMEDYEREIILKTLEFCGGNKSEAARRLGLSRLTMHKKAKAYDLQAASEK